jgi:hypothetical protein
MSSTITLAAEEHSSSQTLSTTDTETTDTDSTQSTTIIAVQGTGRLQESSSDDETASDTTNSDLDNVYSFPGAGEILSPTVVFVHPRLGELIGTNQVPPEDRTPRRGPGALSDANLPTTTRARFTSHAQADLNRQKDYTTAQRVAQDSDMSRQSVTRTSTSALMGETSRPNNMLSNMFGSRTNQPDSSRPDSQYLTAPENSHQPTSEQIQQMERMLNDTSDVFQESAENAADRRRYEAQRDLDEAENNRNDELRRKVNEYDAANSDYMSTVAQCSRLRSEYYAIMVEFKTCRPEDDQRKRDISKDLAKVKEAYKTAQIEVESRALDVRQREADFDKKAHHLQRLPPRAGTVVTDIPDSPRAASQDHEQACPIAATRPKQPTSWPNQPPVPDQGFGFGAPPPQNTRGPIPAPLQTDEIPDREEVPVISVEEAALNLRKRADEIHAKYANTELYHEYFGKKHEPKTPGTVGFPINIDEPPILETPIAPEEPDEPSDDSSSDSDSSDDEKTKRTKKKLKKAVEKKKKEEEKLSDELEQAMKKASKLQKRVKELKGTVSGSKEAKVTATPSSQGTPASTPAISEKRSKKDDEKDKKKEEKEKEKEKQRKRKEKEKKKKGKDSSSDSSGNGSEGSSSDSEDGGKVFKIEKFEGGETDCVHTWFTMFEIYCDQKNLKGKSACLVLNERLGLKPKAALATLDQSARMDYKKSKHAIISTFQDKGNKQEFKRSYKAIKQEPKESYRALLNRLQVHRSKGWPDKPGPSKDHGTRKKIMKAFHRAMRDPEAKKFFFYDFMGTIEDKNVSFEDMIAKAETALNLSLDMNSSMKSEVVSTDLFENKCQICHKMGHTADNCRWNPNSSRERHTSRERTQTKAIEAEPSLPHRPVESEEEELCAIYDILNHIPSEQEKNSNCHGCGALGHYIRFCPSTLLQPRKGQAQGQAQAQPGQAQGQAQATAPRWNKPAWNNNGGTPQMSNPPRPPYDAGQRQAPATTPYNRQAPATSAYNRPFGPPKPPYLNQANGGRPPMRRNDQTVNYLVEALTSAVADQRGCDEEPTQDNAPQEQALENSTSSSQGNDDRRQASGSA